MVSESIPANSKYWDDKPISLTEKTKRHILKKAYRFDAENIFSSYGVDGDDAIELAKQNGLTEEVLMENPNTFTFLAANAIRELEENLSKETRSRAVQALTTLGFTNIYEANTKNFILPPDEEVPQQKQLQPQFQKPQYKRQQTYQQQVVVPQPSPQKSEPTQPISPPETIYQEQDFYERQPPVFERPRPQLPNLQQRKFFIPGAEKFLLQRQSNKPAPVSFNLTHIEKLKAKPSPQHPLLKPKFSVKKRF